MPWFPEKGIAWPSTLSVAVSCGFPSALNTASLFASIFKILSSHNVIKSPSAEDLECSFCMLPYIGFISFVIFSA